MPYQKNTPIINHSVRGLCTHPYRLHKKGCPNFNKKPGCPPKVEFFERVYDMKKPIFFIWNVFDLETHMNKLKEKYPSWSEHQLKCCLYWQPTARKSLLREVKLFLRDYPNYTIENCPEGMGIDITGSMKQMGIELEWPPKTKTYQIAVAAIKK